MALFAEDNSNLYKCIVVSDESKNKVLQILCFDDEGKATSFKDGDIVRLHPDYCEMDERQFLYIKAVQGDMGHNSPQMLTKVYAAILDEDRRKNAAVMEERFYGDSKDIKYQKDV